MSKRAASNQNSNSSPADVPVNKWSRALDRSVDWEKKDLLEVIYWLRQILAIVLGITWGLIPLTGLPAHLLFLSLAAVLPFLYYTKYLGVDDEEERYGRYDLMVEGMGGAFALFILAWTLVYSLPY